ncbi:MAG: PcfB family protein [Clostridia bacterium]|nr:PcfB family protein [Clostridia bacterium]
MNTSAEAADQVVRMSLNGAEVALKITGKGAERAAVLIYKALKDAANESKRTKGAIRLANLARSGKKLDVSEILNTDLKKFCTEAKKYGIVYTVLKDRNRDDGFTEVMYKSEDREKLNRIFERMSMATVDYAEVNNEISPDLTGQNPPERASPETSDPDKFMEELMKKPEKNPTKEEVHNANPSDARPGKHARSGQDSKPRQQARGERDASENSTGRRSVRKELADIRAEMEKEAKESKNKPSRENKTVNHKHTQKKKKSKER